MISIKSLNGIDFTEKNLITLSNTKHQNFSFFFRKLPPLEVEHRRMSFQFVPFHSQLRVFISDQIYSSAFKSQASRERQRKNKWRNIENMGFTAIITGWPHRELWKRICSCQLRKKWEIVAINSRQNKSMRLSLYLKKIATDRTIQLRKFIIRLQFICNYHQAITKSLVHS